MIRPLPDTPLGVYVHFPWCVRLCPYCDFAVVVRPEPQHDAYLTAVLAELEHRRSAVEGRRLRSIYLGGGTPGLWRPGHVGRLVAAIREICEADDDVEITVEHNPETLDRAGAEALREAGVGRLSLGVQSFDDATLAALGRAHTGAGSHEALRTAAAAGFDRLTFDLIFGAPGQDLSAWDRELDAALSHPEASHVSLYQLTVEPQTVFGRQLARGERREPDAEICADLYDRADARLGAAGFVHYEVSSWARAGHESRHNQLYWTGAEYLGLGMGAHSLEFRGGRALRRANTRRIREYLADPVGAPFEEEDIAPRTHLAERLMTGLRTAAGVDLAVLERCVGLDVEAVLGPVLRRLEDEGLLVRVGALLRPTPRGMRLANVVAEAVLP